MSLFSISKIYNNYFIRVISAIRGQLYLLKSLPIFRAFRMFRGQNFFRLLLFLLLPTSYFLLFTCSFLTNPDKTTVSGVVKLEGQTNHSGVKVSLYKLVDLDTTIVRINQQYPKYWNPNITRNRILPP